MGTDLDWSGELDFAADDALDVLGQFRRYFRRFGDNLDFR
jgi:hypothetical protein